mmetsp:Transcript_28014/g.52624  ORF Transcript_28014/g.52624 Transcript_28014/m.52624 type:complete len:176 (+) Transcript_28014:435-962(+)
MNSFVKASAPQGPMNGPSAEPAVKKAEAGDSPLADANDKSTEGTEQEEYVLPTVANDEAGSEGDQARATAEAEDKIRSPSTPTTVTSSLAPNMVVEPLQKIADALEPWLKSQESLSSSEQTQYESMLRVYKEIINVYKGSPNELPEDSQLQVKRLMMELHGLGRPPEAVMKQAES